MGGKGTRAVSKARPSAASNPKRAMNSMSRLGLESVSTETKKDLIDKLRALQSLNAVKNYFMVGSNTIAKAMEAGNVAILIIPRDSPAAVVNHLVESAMWNKIHVLVVPKFVVELRDIFKLRSASCLAIPIRVSVRPSKYGETKKDRKEDKKNEEAEVDEDVASSRVDAFKEFCISLAA